MIEEALKDEVKSSQDLENVIKKYNGSNWDFRGLHEFFDYHVADEEMDAYFKRLFPVRKSGFKHKHLMTRSGFQIPRLRLEGCNTLKNVNVSSM